MQLLYVVYCSFSPAWVTKRLFSSLMCFCWLSSRSPHLSIWKSLTVCSICDGMQSKNNSQIVQLKLWIERIFNWLFLFYPCSVAHIHWTNWKQRTHRCVIIALKPLDSKEPQCFPLVGNTIVCKRCISQYKRSNWASLLLWVGVL